MSDALGVRLFELQGKQLVPTPAALALMAAVEAVFDALARCEQALAPPLRDAHRPHGRERIAATIPGGAPRM